MLREVVVRAPDACRAAIAEHRDLAAAFGGTPSQWACYRFALKLREHKPLLEACIDQVAASVRTQMPEYGRDLAIDASGLPAYANGQRLSKNGPLRKRFSDPEASWGHRSAIRRGRVAGSMATRSKRLYAHRSPDRVGSHDRQLRAPIARCRDRTRLHGRDVRHGQGV